MRTYKQMKGFLIEFEKFMRNRAVAQWNSESNELVDKNCGCCMGAHLARFFKNDYDGANEFKVGELVAEKNIWINGEMTRIMQYVEEWHHSYDIFCREMMWDQHCDETETDPGDDDTRMEFEESCHHMIDEAYDDEVTICHWADSSNHGFNMKSVHFRDGVRALHRLLQIDNDRQREKLFDGVLAHYAKNVDPGIYVPTPWDSDDWMVSDEVHAIKQALLACELYEDPSPYTDSEQQEDININNFICALGDGSMVDELHRVYRENGLYYREPDRREF